MSEDCGGSTSAMAASATTVSGARAVRSKDSQETGWVMNVLAAVRCRTTSP